MIASTAALTRNARGLGFAVPAVNVVDVLSLRAVIAAATAQRSPLIVQVSVKTLRTVGVDLLTFAFREAATEAPVPLCLHLDHCPDRTVIEQVVAAGWSSVLFDASDRDLATAERETREVTQEAHAAGVDVESEIENIVGLEDGVGSAEADHAYSVDVLAAVAERTQVDLLAPALGTAHGRYTSRPKLLPERARELASLTDLPLVLHGGTGLSKEDYAAFIAAGVSKINISTALKVAYLRAAQRHMEKAAERDAWEPLAMFDQVAQAVTDEVSGYLRDFGAAGRAGDVVRGVTA